MIELLTEQANNVQFNLSLDGGSGQDVYHVYLTIVSEGVDYRFRAVEGVDGSWTASVPKSLQLEAGEYAFKIDVIVDNHIYPAVQDTLVVKSPIRVKASVVESAPAVAPAAPKAKVSFIGVKPPGRRTK